MSEEIDNALKEMREKYLSEKMAELDREIVHERHGITPDMISGSGSLTAYPSPVQHELRRIQSVFTVGNAANYDRGLKEYGDDFMKLGRCKRDGEDYPGGFAVNTIDDGLRLIEEQGKTGIWGVYRLDAVWSKDTEPSQNGWWHALVNDARIVERVA